jgi:hypothetical protein
MHTKCRTFRPSRFHQATSRIQRPTPLRSYYVKSIYQARTYYVPARGLSLPGKGVRGNRGTYPFTKCWIMRVLAPHQYICNSSLICPIINWLRTVIEQCQPDALPTTHESQEEGCLTDIRNPRNLQTYLFGFELRVVKRVSVAATGCHS